MRKGPKYWLPRLLAAAIAPLLALAIMEAGLRLAGYGCKTSFFVPGPRAQTLVSNPRFAWRFFGRQASRAPMPLVFTPARKPDTYRIFVLGSSAALGDPDCSVSFVRILEAMLAGRFPNVRFEVLNTSMTAINRRIPALLGDDPRRRVAAPFPRGATDRRSGRQNVWRAGHGEQALARYADVLRTAGAPRRSTAKLGLSTMPETGSLRRWPSKSVAPFIQTWFVPVLMQGDVDFKWKSFPATLTNCGSLVVFTDEPATTTLVLIMQQLDASSVDVRCHARRQNGRMPLGDDLGQGETQWGSDAGRWFVAQASRLRIASQRLAPRGQSAPPLTQRRKENGCCYGLNLIGAKYCGK